jgi:cytochrome P460
VFAYEPMSTTLGMEENGARMAKIHWKPKPNQFFPEATVPGELLNVDFMVKDSKRFADSGGWGWAVFDYNAATDTFSPGTLEGTPPQGNDAKCGFACHTAAKARDYVFTEYGKRPKRFHHVHGSHKGSLVRPAGNRGGTG